MIPTHVDCSAQMSFWPRLAVKKEVPTMTDQLKSMRIRTMCATAALTLISSPTIGSLWAGQGRATQNIETVTEITPQVLVFATSAGSVAASVGTERGLLAAPPSPGR